MEPGTYSRGRGVRGSCPPKGLHGSPQLTILQCQETPSLVRKIVENLWAVSAPPRTPLGELTALLRPPSRWEGLAAPSPRTLPPLSAFSLDFPPIAVLHPNVKSLERPWMEQCLGRPAPWTNVRDAITYPPGVHAVIRATLQPSAFDDYDHTASVTHHMHTLRSAIPYSNHIRLTVSPRLSLFTIRDVDTGGWRS